MHLYKIFILLIFSTFLSIFILFLSLRLGVYNSDVEKGSVIKFRLDSYLDGINVFYFWFFIVGIIFIIFHLIEVYFLCFYMVPMFLEGPASLDTTVIHETVVHVVEVTSKDKSLPETDPSVGPVLFILSIVAGSGPAAPISLLAWSSLYFIINLLPSGFGGAAPAAVPEEVFYQTNPVLGPVLIEDPFLFFLQETIPGAALLGVGVAVVILLTVKVSILVYDNLYEYVTTTVPSIPVEPGEPTAILQTSFLGDMPLPIEMLSMVGGPNTVLRFFSLREPCSLVLEAGNYMGFLIYQHMLEVALLYSDVPYIFIMG